MGIDLLERMTMSGDEEADFTSSIEQHVARGVRSITAGVSSQASIEETAKLWEFLATLEVYLPDVLRELHPEWERESLDGVYHDVARTTGENAIEIAGLCILISDQRLAPFHLQLKVSSTEDEVVWLDLKLGESGPNGMVRMPYNRRQILAKSEIRSRWRQVDWFYHVGFGDRD
jgi:hypothetical protein